MTFEVTDNQLLVLYRKVLVPWEQTYVGVLGHWAIENLHICLAPVSLEISSPESSQIEQQLQSFIDRRTTNFFVFARNKSQGRDLFRHIRNSIAHAGVTRHPQADDIVLLRFKSPTSNKKAVAMAGQLDERHLPAVLQGLHAMASSAHAKSEANHLEGFPSLSSRTRLHGR